MIISTLNLVIALTAAADRRQQDISPTGTVPEYQKIAHARCDKVNGQR